MMILLTLRHFWKKSLKWLFIVPNEKLFCHKNFEIPCRDFKLAKYWNVLHNHYKWRVSTFEPLHGISKFLWLNNFSLGAMKKSFQGFFQKCLSLNKTIILTPSRQNNSIFSKGHQGSSIFFLPPFFAYKIIAKYQKIRNCLFKRHLDLMKPSVCYDSL